MRGVLLCGGQGTRLRPFTEVVNKHLIRVGKLPMAEYPLLKMIEAGIKDLMVVSGGENFAAVVKYFGSGKKWNVSIVHAIQDEAGGIAQALWLARHFADKEKLLVVLGDNLFSMNLADTVREFEHQDLYRSQVYVTHSDTPERFGVVINDENGNPCDIVEKPLQPPTNIVQTGIYLYDSSVFRIIQGLEPSHRKELEITDVNRHYLKHGLMRLVKMNGWWTDCGTMDTLVQAEQFLSIIPNAY